VAIEVARSFGAREHVDVVHLEDLVEGADRDDILDEDDQRLWSWRFQIVADAEALAARVHAALAEGRELAAATTASARARVDVRHHDALGAVERA